MSELDLIQIFAEDKRMILYRPEWRRFTGSVTATILLQQIIYHWDRYGRRPFYKFKEPCEHHLYNPGDSWCEELGFSRKEFDNAIKKIGYKKSKAKKARHKMPVEYWIDPSRTTYYAIHAGNLHKVLLELYGKNMPKVSENEEKTGNINNDNSGITVKPQRDVRKSPFGDMEKTQKDVRKSPKGTLYVKSQKGVRKSSKGTLYNICTEITAEKETATERQINSEKNQVDLPTPLAAAISSAKIKKIIELIPVKVTPSRQAWIIDKAKKCDFDYLCEKILYSNRQVKDKRKYWAYLGKAIDYDYGQCFLSDLEAEQEALSKAAAKAEQAQREEVREEQALEQAVIQEDALREKTRKYFFELSPEEQQGLRDGFLKQAKPFEKKRIDKLTLADTCRSRAFLDYCAGLFSENMAEFGGDAVADFSGSGQGPGESRGMGDGAR